MCVCVCVCVCGQWGRWSDGQVALDWLTGRSPGRPTAGGRAGKAVAPGRPREGGSDPRPLAPLQPTHGEAGQDWGIGLVKIRPEKQSLGRLNPRMGLMLPKCQDGTGSGGWAGPTLHGSYLTGSVLLDRACTPLNLSYLICKAGELD